MKACIVDQDGAGPEPAAHAHFLVNPRGKNGASVNIVVVEEKKHFTPNTPFCFASNKQIATHPRRISSSDASTAE
ncbi:hypothetical protein PoB_005940900 [Plakobranchus ocellatus]|uniref:Uncharacterized protein n=1 Tax=Plakobranchus ocellatus TaxID=259542 RepID=A0AAV4CN03_9GAST|nr:hypothetical protein PoB_005940900 [Plakobranchus ocellatus]